MEKVEDNAIVLSCIHSSYPITIQRKLEKSPFLSIDLFSFINYSGFNITVNGWSGFEESYKTDREKYDFIYKRLNDDISKDTFKRIVNFRLNKDLSQMEVFHVNVKNQYFEPFLNLQMRGESFVDVGGYDGETSINFIERCPNYDSLFYVEPEPEIMNIAKRKLIGNNIRYLELCASNKEQILKFTSQQFASRISDDGELVIHASTIDKMIGDERVTFIKMDIEGAESEAIDGARMTILKNHPIMAICVYHKTDDLIKLPLQILDIRSDYNLYLRHYTEGTSETVMFFVPIKN